MKRGWDWDATDGVLGLNRWAWAGLAVGFLIIVSLLVFLVREPQRVAQPAIAPAPPAEAEAAAEPPPSEYALPPIPPNGRIPPADRIRTLTLPSSGSIPPVSLRFASGTDTWIRFQYPLRVVKFTSTHYWFALGDDDASVAITPPRPTYEDGSGDDPSRLSHVTTGVVTLNDGRRVTLTATSDPVGFDMLLNLQLPPSWTEPRVASRACEAEAKQLMLLSDSNRTLAHALDGLMGVGTAVLQTLPMPLGGVPGQLAAPCPAGAEEFNGYCYDKWPLTVEQVKGGACDRQRLYEPSEGWCRAHLAGYRPVFGTHRKNNAVDPQ